MNCRRGFLSFVILLAVFVSMFIGGCDTREDEFDPFTVPVFTTVPGDLWGNIDQLQSKLDVSDNDIFRISDTGAVMYYRSGSDWQLPIQMTDSEAVRQATAYLDEWGLLPDDGYRTYVSRITRAGVDPNGEKDPQPVTVQIDVFFYRVFNSIDVVSDQEDGVILSLDAHGICSLRYYWRTIETTKISEDEKSISADVAHQIFLDKWDSIVGIEYEPFENPEIFKAYLQVNGQTRPCWVIAENRMYLNAWFIDMLTGEVLFE